MNQPNILIAAPISNRSWVLSYYLDHLYALSYPKNKISFYFLLNNSKDQSEQILRRFKKQHEHEYKQITIETYKSNLKFEDNRTPEVRLQYSYYHLSELRNKVLKFTSSSDADLLLSCDSDILLQPDTLNKLLSHKVDICAALIYNGYHVNPTQPYLYPNILKLDENNKGYVHIRNWYIKNAPTLKDSKLMEIDATGACVLMSKEVAQKTSYSWHPQGEDLAWSKDCQDKGYRLYCDVSAFNYHIMSKEILDEYNKNKQKGEVNEPENNSICEHN